jgi:energy-coupling factor transport system ATP-binding protein
MLLVARGLGYRPARGPFELGSIDLNLDGGTFALLSGDNGSGKSTLLRLLAGRAGSLAGTVRGSLTLLGKDALSCEGSALFGSVASMGPRPEAELFCPTVREEIAFALENLGLAKREREDRVERVAGQFGIAGLLSAESRKLSGGEQKLALMAALMALKPRVLLLDEPLAGLSVGNRRLVAQILRDHADKGNLVVMAEHGIDDVADRPERELRLESGRLAYDGAFRHPARATNGDCPREEGPWEESPYADNGEPRARSIVAIGNATPGTRVECPARLSAETLEFAYGTVRVIGIADLAIPNGISLLRGENGAGKSTLLRLLRGLLEPTRGRVRFDGREIRRASAALALGFVPQESGRQFFCLSAREELEFGLRFRPAMRRGPGRQTALKRIDRLVGLFGLGDLLDAYPEELSTGERRRLSLATTLALEPTFLLLDECENGLDARYRHVLEGELLRLAESGVGLLASVHGDGFLRGKAAREFTLSGGAVGLRALTHPGPYVDARPIPSGAEAIHA